HWAVEDAQAQYLAPPRALQKITPARKVAGASPSTRSRLEPIENLVCPEALETVQRLVEGRELLGVDAADLLNGAHVFLVERLDDIADFAPLVSELDADRAPIDSRTLVIEERHFDELLEIVGNVGAKVVAARAQFAGRQFLVTDIVEQQR